MKKLYEFGIDFGRMGDLEGLFIAEEEDVQNLIGKTIYFGEVLGKHSEIEIEFIDECVTVKSDDQDFIGKLIEVFDLGEGGTISGCNPLSFYEPE